MDLKNKASNLGIKYFLLAYSTLNTDSRFFLVPTEGIENVQKNGLCFTPARFFKCGVNECGFKLYPVPETFVQLPWKQEFAWIHGEIYFNDAPFNQCPRSVLRKQVEKAKKLGYLMMAGFEPEFLLLDKDGKDFTYSRAIRQSIHLHDGRSIMRDSKLLCRIHGVMETLGWKPYQIVHEDSICQYEINFGYADALETADRYFFMKFMVKELAEEEGYTATFMPIPSNGDLICANGLHINMSLWSEQEKTNLFPDNKDKEIGISKLARHFIGGLLEHVQESCAVLCPTVNSYKRINAGSWCPSIINWGTNNKSVMLRIPNNDRVEHRLPDGGTNLYLTLALLLAAGLDGMIKNTEPGPMTSKEAHPEAKKLPNNLYEALSAMKTSDFVMKCLGPDIVDGFVLLKMQEWNLYVSQITKWEKEFYLDC